MFWDANGTKMFKVAQCSKLESLIVVGIDFKVLECFHQAKFVSASTTYLRLQCYQNQYQKAVILVHDIICGFPNLQSLNLGGTKTFQIQDFYICSCFVGDGLISIDISYCALMDDSVILCIAYDCPRLRTLNISGCGLVTNASLDAADCLYLCCVHDVLQ